jgi:1,2-dihydroxy-3-keto-5-methylthiopentene dioxygenase
MSRLTVYADHAPATPELVTADPARIAAELAPIGVQFERWESPVAIADDATPETILEAYRPYLDRLMGANGAGSADVIRLRPGAANYDALRAKFLAEHTHTEDEIRFFVHGAGSFVLHVDGRVYDAHCTAGDLIAVPANIRHWFDAGTAPNFTALRVFTDTSGWVPHYTGDAISERFPVG